MLPVDTPMRTEEKQGFAAIFTIFLILGLTSFGGPAAHLGYFRNEFVMRRRWLDEEAYAYLLALCQFLPGPVAAPPGSALPCPRP
jgi:chromate transporter